MKIDYDYLQELLSVFIESEKSCVTFDHFKKLLEIEGEDKFFFHLQILTDRLMVSQEGKPPEKGLKALGFVFSLDGNCHFGICNWRLTADGHDFAVDLNKPKVLEFIKTQLKEEGFSAVVDVAKSIGSKLLENKLKQLGF